MVPIKLEINESFFEEEVRSGFLVTRQRKELWAIELDLLAELDRICRKHGLCYCVGAGTMLGAVRHKGFIPWDDDLDVYMFRDDFERLLQLDSEFTAPYFLQTTFNEPNLIRTFARIRNTQTTGTTTKEQNLNICKGIFIDIFPLDGISSNKYINRYQYWLNKGQRMVFGCFNHSRGDNPDQSLKGKLRHLGYTAVAKVFIRNKIKAYNAAANNIKRFSNDKAELWGNRTLVFMSPKSRRPKEDYKDVIYVPFEMLSVPVPRKYDELLKQQYGDYMKIPENKNGSVHGELIVNTDYPYDEFRSKK